MILFSVDIGDFWQLVKEDHHLTLDIWTNYPVIVDVSDLRPLVKA